MECDNRKNVSKSDLKEAYLANFDKYSKFYFVVV